MSSCVIRTTNVSRRQHALECDVCRQLTTFFCADSDDNYTFLVLVQGRKFQGTKVPGNESSRERKFHVTFAPGSECSRERKYQGAKVPPRAKVRGNESSIIRPSQSVCSTMEPCCYIGFHGSSHKDAQENIPSPACLMLFVKL